MRSSNHLAIKETCHLAIAPLMAKHGLGLPTKILMDETGWVNPCFFINDQFVFRFNARDPDLPKYQREKIAFDLLKTSDIPVPQKVILDESKSVAPFDVLISEIIPGENLESAWPRLPLEQRQNLAENAGKIFKKLSAIPMPFFGELGTTSPFPKTKSWEEYLRAKLDFHLAEALELKIFDQATVEMFWNAFNRHSSALSEVKNPCLVHVDFHLGNLLFKDNQITGVVDFEWAFGGDPLYDLCRWHQEVEEWPDSRDSFLKGCQKNTFSTSETKRIKVYQMIRNVELCIVAHRHFTFEESEGYKKTTITQLETV
jgi:aminoglycoside phosphotransferase (APT) family kinase protein